MSATCDCRRGGNAPSIPCHAVHFLWYAYYDWAGMEGYELCARLGIPINRMKKAEPFCAYLFPDKFVKGGSRVQLPPVVPNDMSAREGLLIYHELAHHVLKRDHPFFRHKTARVRTEFDVQEEAWCDSFALAMLLAFFGWEPLTNDRQAHAFLRYGELIGRPRNDILLAWRIRREMRRPRRNHDLPPAPLILLSKALLACAEAAK
ncbi:MAG: hypothetical protein AAB554_03010 [Patescibacteria group bacterium]